MGGRDDSPATRRRLARVTLAGTGVSLAATAPALAARGVGEMAAVATLPAPVLVLFALLTQLGDPWFVFALLTVTYWAAPRGLTRRRAATLFALAAVAATLTILLKVSFHLPRPPGALTATAPPWLPAPLAGAYLDVATDTGFGFPSGHALASTVVYGGLAALLDRWTRRRRVAVAAALVGTVTLSRVVLQLHYLVDVAVGTGLGLVVVGLAVRLPRWRGGAGQPGGDGGHEGNGRRPGAGQPGDDGLGGDDSVATAAAPAPVTWFAVAAVLGALGAVVAALQGYPGEVHDAVVAVGSALGGAGGWQVWGTDGGTPIPVAVAVGGAVVAGGLWGFAYSQEWLPLAVAGLVGAAGIGLVIALPGLVERRYRIDR